MWLSGSGLRVHKKCVFRIGVTEGLGFTWFTVNCAELGFVMELVVSGVGT